MIVNIKENPVKLNKREQASCTRIITKIIERVRVKAAKNNSPTYYYTFIIVMHIVSGMLIDLSDPKVMAKIMDAFDLTYPENSIEDDN